MDRFRFFSYITVVLFLFLSNTSFSQNVVTGVVTYHSDNQKPLSNVVVGVYDLNDNFIMSTITDSDGDYTLYGVPSIEFNIKLLSNNSIDLPDLMDAYLTFQDLTNNITLDGAAYEAADINNDELITSYDFSQILVSLIYGQFNVGSDWQFNSTYIDYSSRTVANDTIHFWGTNEGDVDSSWDPSGRLPSIFNYKNSTPKIISSKNTTLNIGTEFNGLVSGFHLNLSYPMDNIEIVNITGPDDNFSYNLDPRSGTLRVSWINTNSIENNISGTNLFKVEVKQIAGETFGVKDFVLLSDGMVIDNIGKKITDIEVVLPSVELVNDIINVHSYPNPVTNNLNFSINTPSPESFNVSLYDMSGRLIFDANSSILETGNNNFSIDVNSLMPGHYFYIVRNLNGEFVLPGQFVKIL